MARSEALDRILNALRSRPANPDATLDQRRAGMESFARPAPADVECEPVDAGGVPAEWITAPGAVADRALLYLHGGGYTQGSINTHRELCARISRAAAVKVLALDYRLGPENPFPAAVDDGVAGYKWLLSQGFAPSKIAISGDSAGGGLTAATLIAARDAGLPMPACAALISPWLDLEGTGDSMTSRAALDPMVGPGLKVMANDYLAGADPRTPLASPIYADLTGLPPLLIQVGTSETLFDDSTRFDARARVAGVQVTFESWDDMFHVWHSVAGLLPEGVQAIERIGAFVQSNMQ
ncbi:alpha/beta hydrolase [bacterium SCGC AG-212-C10]|nr:alpha/beta hydrolase [bacterium SCGC AG-212-C10]